MMDLVTINRNPIEVAQSKRGCKTFELRGCTIPALQKSLADITSAFETQGLPLLRLEFSSTEDADGTTQMFCTVIASRMETDDEVAARIARHEAYNASQIAEHKAKTEASQRRKELDRLTGHLTIEQLRALPAVSPLDVREQA